VSPLHSPLKIALVSLFLCLFVLFGFWKLGVCRPNTPPQTRIIVTETAPPLRRQMPQKAPVKDFYRVIIDNNLFRPLGWTPPRQSFPYRLIGTLIATDGDTPPKAFLQTTNGQKTHAVELGSTLGGWKVQAIAKKQVTLEKDGQPTTLRLETYHTLTPKRRTGYRRR